MHIQIGQKVRKYEHYGTTQSHYAITNYQHNECTHYFHVCIKSTNVEVDGHYQHGCSITAIRHRITIIQINMYSFLVDANVGNIKTSTSFHLGVFADHHFAFLQAFCCISFTLCSSILRFFPRFNLNFDIITIFCNVHTVEKCTKRVGKEKKNWKSSHPPNQSFDAKMSTNRANELIFFLNLCSQFVSCSVHCAKMFTESWMVLSHSLQHNHHRHLHSFQPRKATILSRAKDGKIIHSPLNRSSIFCRCTIKHLYFCFANSILFARKMSETLCIEVFPKYYLLYWVA